MVKASTETYIVKPQKIRDLAYHYMAEAEKELGPSFRMMDKSVVPESDITLIVRKIERDPGPGYKKTELHTHDVNKVYAFVGDGLKSEVIIGDDHHIITAPGAVFIPAGTKHGYRPISGTGYLIMTMRKGEYP